MQNSVHYESGSKSEIAVILSCPGREEEQASPKAPAQGQTGKNLEGILDILSNDYGLQGFNRDEIIITNAWDQVEYPEKTERSEATTIEVLEKNNLDRLFSEIENISDFILACGQRATAAIMALIYAKKIHSDVKIAFVEHLGNQALNLNISIDLDGNEIKSYGKAADRPTEETRTLDAIRKDNKLKRLKVVAYRINEQIKS